MIQGIRKAPNRASKAPISCGQGHRSGHSIQRVVEPVIRPVQIADERMGSVQTEGGISTCPQGADRQPYARRHAITRHTPNDARGTRPFPPSPLPVRWWGFPAIFPSQFG